MLRSIRPLPVLLSMLSAVLLAGARPAAGQGLAQITFEGEITREGGARVEITVGVRVEGVDLQVDLGLHLARGTSAGDVAGFLASRLARAGFDVLSPAARSGSEGAVAHVFVEEALFVRLRAGHGLRFRVTTGDSVPTRVRVSPPQVNPRDARLVVAASTYSQHTRTRGLHSVEIPLAAVDHAAQVTEKIHKGALNAGWIGFRPESRSWRPGKLKDASVPTGFSLELDSEGDWGVEIELPKREE